MLVISRFQFSSLKKPTLFPTLARRKNNFSALPEKSRLCPIDYVSFLQYLGDEKEINHGKSLHSVLVKTGLDQDVFVQNNLIRFYSACGRLPIAHQVFDEISEPNLVSWTSMISSCVHNDKHEMGLSMFSQMCSSGLLPNEFGFSVVLKSCRVLNDFVMGELVHSFTIKCGFELCSFCSASILGVYVESGNYYGARKVFDGIPLSQRSEALWNTLMDGYVRSSDTRQAVDLFHQMVCSNTEPNFFTYVHLIQLGVTSSNFDLGLLHDRIVKTGFENDRIIGGALIDAYAKLGLLADAYKVFLCLEEKDNMAWCSLLSGYYQSNEVGEGLSAFINFFSEGHKPDAFTFATVFSLCSKSETEEIGSQVHCSLIKSGFVLDSFLGSALVDMYGNKGMIDDAYRCFVDIRDKNEVCFSAMIGNFILQSKNGMALSIFHEMRQQGFEPTHSTLSYILRACAKLHLFREGKSIHCHILKDFLNFDSDLCAVNALIEMYAECGVATQAKLVFEATKTPNEFSWTAIISAFCESGEFKEALRLFRNMLVSPTTAKPSHFTLIPVLQSCTETRVVVEGKHIHCYIIKVGFEQFPFVGSALISMYATFENEIRSASLVFSSLIHRDLVSWSSMLTALVDNRCEIEALNLYTEFQNSQSFSIDESVLSSCLSSCSGLASLEHGKLFHACALKAGFEFHVNVAASVIDMYSKCGGVIDARKFFDGLKNLNVVTWTAMIFGYAHHGLGTKAVELFEDKKEAGFKPDGVTFIGVLTACSHAGLLEEGWKYFKSMVADYGLELTVNHYSCIVDLLGRLEYVDEAEALIKRAPFPSKALLWKTLLGACRNHGNSKKGNQIANRLMELEPNEPSTYVLLSNIYAAASMWDELVEVRNKMKDDYVVKQPGCSWIPVMI